ncbi:MAG: DUF6340 family protein [Phocaeicola sp.]
MKKIKTYLGLFLSIAFSSCGSTMQIISFEQLEASQINFPESVMRVAVINTVERPSEAIYGKEIPVKLVGDGVVASSLLAEALAEANYFDQVLLCDSVLKITNSVTGIIPKEKIQALTQELGVDLLFSIDSLNITNRAFLGYLGPELSASIRPQIRIYIPDRELPLLSIVKSDTLYWSIVPTLNSQDIVQEASAYVAKQVLPFLVPHWKTIDRNYYDGGNYQMRDAALFLREGEWEEAFALWQDLYANQKGATRMRAAYNMVLYYEMKEDLESARKLLIEVIDGVNPKSLDASFLNSYLKELDERQTRVAKLRIQMKRFSDNL